MFELDDVLAGALERLAPSLAGRSLDVGLPPLPVRVDPIFLDDAFTNVVENAVRHTPAGGSHPDQRPTDDDDLVTLTVEDGGDGVPDSDLAASVREVLPGTGRPTSVTARHGHRTGRRPGSGRGDGRCRRGPTQRPWRAGHRHRRCPPRRCRPSSLRRHRERDRPTGLVRSCSSSRTTTRRGRRSCAS